jgi:hypothetical protein
MTKKQWAWMTLATVVVVAACAYLAVWLELPWPAQ